MLVLSTVCTLILSAANIFYQKASVIFEKRLYQVILDLFAIESSPENVVSVFGENFSVNTIAQKKYYLNKNNNIMVFKAEGPGLWSRIEILLAVNPDRESLYGLRIIQQAETPGLGGRIAESEFMDSFKDREIRPVLKIVKFAQNVNEIDAISGATKTSKALENIINNGIRKMDTDIK